MENTFTRYLSLLIIAALSSLSVEAQQFWLTTNEFWGGPKTGIELADDSVFFVSTTNSVLRSTNAFNQLELVLTASEIHTIFASAGGKLLAGGSGKVFFSDDLGANWDSTVISTTYPLKQFVVNAAGDLFAITGVHDEGDGVFFSEDGGVSWEKRNSGLGNYLGCDKIAIGENNRLFLAISDEAVTGMGGLFISENSGLDWEKINVGIDSINSSVRIGTTTNLSILPNDSVYLSFYGSGGNFGVELNIYKSLNDVSQNNAWDVLDLKHYQVSGMDDAMNNIYISQNGDWYSSTSESVRSGGTCYSKNGKNWNVLDYGLGTDIYSRRNEQFFVETSNGRIFMIQYMDERIYTTDTSIVTNTPRPIEVNSNIKIYPNPVRKGENLTLELETRHHSAEISFYDITGRRLFYTQTNADEMNIPAPTKDGIYVVSVKKGMIEEAMKFVVN